MRTTVSFAALALLAAPLAAQNVRSVTQIDAGTTTGVAFAPSVSSDGNLTAVVYNDGDLSGMPGTGTNNVYAVLSDARGLTFGATAVVDGDAGLAAKFTQFDSCWVYGSNIYVVWRDTRNDVAATTSIVESDLYCNVSHDSGATWMGEVLLDKGYPVATNSRTVRDFAVHVNDNGTASGADDHVYVLTSTEGPSSGNEELYMVSSHDGGATFSAAVPVSALAAGTADIDYIAVASHGMNVHVAWQDNRFGGSGFDDVWYQRSSDGGATWQVADAQLNDISGGQGDGEFEMSIAVDPSNGSLVAVCWQEERTSTSNEELQVNVSTDGGATWNGDALVGSYGSTVDVDFAIGGLAVVDGRITVTWNDHRNGPATGDDDVFVATSSDNGATWSADVELSVNGGAFSTLGRPRAGQDCLVATWTYDVFPNAAESAFSRDAGATWNTASAVNVSANTGDVDFAEIAYNTLYNNAIAVYLSDDSGSNRLFAGGYRPQTLTAPATVTAGQTISFSVSNYCSAENDTRFAVLASGGTGGFTLANGINTGLANDAILSQAIGLIQAAVTGGMSTGVLNGTINGAGAGMTANLTFPGSVPAGTNLHLVGVGFDLPPLSFGSVTDVEVMVVL